MKNLKENSTPGEDNVHPKVLKECHRALAIPLTKIFKTSLTTGNLPRDWLSAIVSPIFKKGSKAKVENYRPVSLTSHVCKVLESIIRDHIVVHLKAENLINENQHGFVKGKSCLTNLLHALDYLTSTLDEGKCVDGIYLDYRKAFDSVPHQRLLLKLRAYGLNDSVMNWIQNFLNHRTQKVSIRGSYSKSATVISGVPQGSVLGPLLFILYVNDIPDTVNSEFYMYADDSKLLNECGNSDVIQNDLDLLSDWSKVWLLKFNEDKCKVIHFGHDNPQNTYTLNETPLSKAESEVDLGVTITSDSKPSEQCSKVAKKAMQRLGILKRTFKHIDIATFRVIYPTYVRPLMEYAVQAWNPYYAKDIECLEKVQKYATQLIPEIAHLNYEERLEKLNLYSLEQRRLRGQLIETFKILSGKYEFNHEKLFKFSDTSNTRGHTMKLYKPTLKKGLMLRKNFFNIAIINTWNDLPQGVVTASTVDTFKNRLDRHWKTTFRYGTQGASPIN